MINTVVKIFVLITTCFIASFFTGLSLNKLYKKQLLKSSFGIICAADILIFISFMLEYSIATILALLSFETFLPNLGYLCFFLSSTTIFFQVLKAINRLCAILFYWKYSTIFSFKTTIIYIILTFIVNALLILPYLFDECNLHYDLKYFTWQTSPEKCNISFWIQSNLYIICLPFAVILNAISSFFLCCKNINEHRKLSKYEKRFLIQTCTTSINTTFFLIFFNFISALFDSTEFSNFFFMCFGTLLYCITNEIFIYISLMDFKKCRSTSVTRPEK